jgi:O-antigen/teichoic acid export membrane protein
MENNKQDVKQVKSKSILSIASLFFNSSYTAALGFAAMFILTWKSSTALFGLYSTVLASMTFFNYITNLGLAAALVQKKKVQQIDLNSAFFTQLILVIIAVIVGVVFDNQILAQYKDLPPNTIYLYWSLLASLFILSLKTIPSVLMDKDMEIYKNVIAQMVEKTIFYIVIIVMIFSGHDVEALIAGTLAQAIIGTVLVFFLRPWRPTFSYSLKSTWELLKFGIPFQGNSFLALVKDDLMTIYLGTVIGLDKLGIVYFGKKYAEISIRIATDNINRVSFPLFSRFQENKEILTKSIKKVLFYNAFIVFPVIIGAMFIFDSLLHVIPGNSPGEYYEKWKNALFSFYIFSIYALLISMTTPFINLFNATKKVHLSVMFMVLSTILIWITVPLGVLYYGMNAISVGFLITSFTFFIVLAKAKDFIQANFFYSLRGVFIGSLAMAVYLGIIRTVSLYVLESYETHLVFSLLGAPIVYFLTLTSIHGFDFIKDVTSNLFQKKEIEKNIESDVT